MARSSEQMAQYETRKSDVLQVAIDGCKQTSKIAKKTQIPQSTVTRLIRELKAENRIHKMWPHKGPEPDPADPVNDPPPDLSPFYLGPGEDPLRFYDLEGFEYQDHLNIEDPSVKKVVSFGDVHVPFQLTEALRKAILTHHDADIFAFPGDLFDAFAISVFFKLKELEAKMREIIVGHYARHPEDGERYGHETHPILCELFTVREIFNFIRANTEARIVVSRGNHEDRLRRWVAKLEIMHLLGIESDNLLETLDEEPRVTVVNHWHFNINDCLFAHPHNFSKAFGKTASDVLDYFLDKHPEEGLPPWSTVIVPHTHMTSQGRRRGKLMIEPGCMGASHYGDDGRLSSVVPSPGYGVIYQENGVTDLNRSGFVLVEPMKKTA